MIHWIDIDEYNLIPTRKSVLRIYAGAMPSSPYAAPASPPIMTVMPMEFGTYENIRFITDQFHINAGQLRALVKQLDQLRSNSRECAERIPKLPRYGMALEPFVSCAKATMSMLHMGKTHRVAGETFMLTAALLGVK